MVIRFVLLFHSSPFLNFVAVLQSPEQLFPTGCICPLPPRLCTLYPRLRLLPAVPSHQHLRWRQEDPAGHLYFVPKRSEPSTHRHTHTLCLQVLLLLLMLNVYILIFLSPSVHTSLKSVHEALAQERQRLQDTYHQSTTLAEVRVYAFMETGLVYEMCVFICVRVPMGAFPYRLCLLGCLSHGFYCSSLFLSLDCIWERVPSHAIGDRLCSWVFWCEWRCPEWELLWVWVWSEWRDNQQLWTWGRTWWTHIHTLCNQLAISCFFNLLKPISLLHSFSHSWVPCQHL